MIVSFDDMDVIDNKRGKWVHTLWEKCVLQSVMMKKQYENYFTDGFPEVCITRK